MRVSKLLVRHAALSIAALALLALAGAEASASGTLPLLAVADGDASSAWWVDGTDASDVELTILAKLAAGGGATVAPGPKSKRPRLSKLHRVSSLSDQRAKNLAGLFDADKTLVGQAKVSTENDAIPLAGLSACEIALQARLVGPKGQRVLELTVVEKGFGPSAEEARADALERMSARVAHAILAKVEASAAPVGVARTEPYLVVSGLKSLGQMRRLEGALKAHADVVDVRVGWVSEGLVAFDINGAQDDSVDALRTIRDAVVASPPNAMKLTTLDTPGQSELRVLVSAD